MRVSRILLIYDDSEKAREALYIAAYYGARYGCGLHILMPDKDSKSNEEAIDFAQEYLKSLNLDYQTVMLSHNELAENLTTFIEENSISTVMLGGYSTTGLLERIFSSTIDHVLELSPVPVLVC